MININSELEAKLEETVKDCAEKEKMAKAEVVTQFTTITQEKAAEKSAMSTLHEAQMKEMVTDYQK